MSNQYGSKTRRFTAPSAISQVIAPPADMVLAAPGSAQFWIDPAVLNVNSNIIIRRSGVFSNFADGLIFKSPPDLAPPITFKSGNPLRYRITVLSFDKNRAAPLANPSVTMGAITVTAGSDIVTGAGFLALPAFTFPGISVAPGIILYVDTVIDNNNIRLVSNAPVSSTPGAIGTWCSGVNAGNILMYTTVLNDLLETNQFILPILPSVYIDDVTDIAFVGTISAVAPLSFMTKSIDTTYAGEYCNFDVVADFEFTGV